VLIGGFVAFLWLGGGDILSINSLARHRAFLVAYTNAHAVEALAMFVLIYALAVAFSLPGALWLTVTGGFLFGPVLGTIASALGATAGAAVVFLAARYVAGEALRRRAGGALNRLQRGFQRNAWSYLLFLRLVPVFPFWLVNLAPAFFGVPLTTYVWTTVLGILPAAFVYSTVGQSLGTVLDAGDEPELDILLEPEILVSLLGLAALSLLPIVWRRKDSNAGEEER
jgi:uncharacterized membrane protein YdjX (TVP38/TMEM64 family)